MRFLTKTQATAVGMIMVQARCSHSEAVALLVTRAEIEPCTVQALARAVVEYRADFIASAISV